MSPDLTRRLPDAQRWPREHLTARRHPLADVDPDAAARTIDTLPGTDPVAWAGHWTATAAECAERATALDDPPLEQVTVPFAGREGEGDSLTFHVARPRGRQRPPAVIAALGMSFGGYGAMKLAHTHHEHLAAAVNWGGGVHITFQPEWQEKSRNAASYLMDLMAARERILGGSTFEDCVASCPALSLLDQGVLDRTSAPLLLVNGTDDLQNSSEDSYLSLRYGDPKTVRMFPGGHMGTGPVRLTIAAWRTTRLTDGGR
ncbi:alpha/beta hydrolase family protein [Streptomyces coffeae]|uniref:Alpha/beta hydrolase n=1 Tax=Streptomyces coffeae TaxID=621382 RepID=A0ABS1NN62_9ACTN|nr:alpha/beta hydrolase [Streptomyces coffeae]MBL1101506.1 alpha/beta hydrolase [Streptomyces coffeae]